MLIMQARQAARTPMVTLLPVHRLQPIDIFVTKVSKTNIHQLTAQNSRYKALTELLAEPDKPMLEPPKIMRVLMLPYKGENDELFMTRYVYLKLKESQWVLTDISEKAKAVQ